MGCCGDCCVPPKESSKFLKWFLLSLPNIKETLSKIDTYLSFQSKFQSKFVVFKHLTSLINLSTYFSLHC